MNLTHLATLDFTNKGEAFVESRFITPLLEGLGYEAHKDYEVRRHGDDGTAFKLRYPPVERGGTQGKALQSRLHSDSSEKDVLGYRGEISEGRATPIS